MKERGDSFLPSPGRYPPLRLSICMLLACCIVLTSGCLDGERRGTPPSPAAAGEERDGGGHPPPRERGTAPPGRLNEAGIEAMKRGELHEALSYFREAAAKAPGEWRYLYNQAEALKRLRRYSEAARILERAAGMSDDPMLTLSLADCRLEDGRFVEARREYLLFLAAPPRGRPELRAYASYRLARTYEEGGDEKKALHYFEQAAKTISELPPARTLPPSTGSAALWRGALARLQAGDTAGAECFLKALKRLYPRASRASALIRGWLLASRGEWTEAALTFEQALSEPRHPGGPADEVFSLALSAIWYEVWRRSGRSQREMLEKSLRYAISASKSKVLGGIAALWKAMVYLQLGEPGKALAAAREASHLPEGRLLESEACWRLGRRNESLRLLAGLRDIPQASWLLFVRAVRLDRPATAAEALDELVRCLGETARGATRSSERPWKFDVTERVDEYLREAVEREKKRLLAKESAQGGGTASAAARGPTSGARGTPPEEERLRRVEREAKVLARELKKLWSSATLPSRKELLNIRRRLEALVSDFRKAASTLGRQAHDADSPRLRRELRRQARALGALVSAYKRLEARLKH